MRSTGRGANRLFILRFLLGFVIGYFIYAISFLSCECLRKKQALSVKAIVHEFQHAYEKKITSSCLLMMTSIALISCISNFYYSQLWQSIVICGFCACLCAISYIDMHTMLIPNHCLIFLCILGIGFLFAPLACSWTQRFYGMFSISGFMILINMMQKDSFGGGDIKLMAVCGFYLGADCAILAMLMAVCGGGLYAIWLIYIKKIGLKAHIAFAPFLCTSLMIAIFIGEQLVSAYISLLI